MGKSWGRKAVGGYLELVLGEHWWSMAPGNFVDGGNFLYCKVGVECTLQGSLYLAKLKLSLGMACLIIRSIPQQIPLTTK